MTAKWELLPHNPRGFFGLGDTFERKELKRAYNVLLKQYKPEKFPEEFKRLRAAYESLDRELRYGQSAQSAIIHQQYEWSKSVSNPAASLTTNSTSDLAQPAPEAVPFHERFQKESPVAIYKELKSRQEKTPYEFFTLALTADIITNDPLLFFQWIATGISKHPEDQGLLNLLKEYFETSIDPESLPKVLAATSKVIKTDLFYFLTESSWHQLLRKQPFHVFQQTLKQCESNLKLFNDRGKHAFYSHILKHAIWKADEQWLEQVFDFLDGNASVLGADAEFNLHVLEKMRDYRGKFETLIKDDPVRQKIHTAIVEYYAADIQDGDPIVIECQLDIADSPESILSAFPANLLEDEKNGAISMWIIWNAMSEEVLERNGMAPPEIKPEKFMTRLFKLMADLNSTWEVNTFQTLTYYAMNFLPYLFFAALPIFLFGSWIFTSPTVQLVTPFLMIGGIGLFHFWLRPKTVEPRFSKMLQKSIRRQYSRLWRGRFVQFFEATQATMGDMSQGLFQIVYNNNTNLTAATYLVDFVPNDLGIAFYSQAARFRT